jgi:hypothetical protein
VRTVICVLFLCMVLSGCEGERLGDQAILSDFHRVVRGGPPDIIDVDRILEIRIEEQQGDRFVARVYFAGTCGRSGKCPAGTHQQLTYHRSKESGAWRLAFTSLAGERK